MSSSQLARPRRLEDVHDVLLAIAHALNGLGAQSACVLHCMQPHRSDFYRQIERDFSVRVLLCHPRGGIKATITKVTLGVSALILIDDYDKLPSLFARIGEQSMAALYTISRSTLAAVSDLARLNASEITAVIRKDPAHLVYQVDEDSAVEDNKVLELLSVGTDCPQVLREAVGLDGVKAPGAS